LLIFIHRNGKNSTINATESYHQQILSRDLYFFADLNSAGNESHHDQIVEILPLAQGTRVLEAPDKVLEEMELKSISLKSSTEW
jgi:hypothetical protein